MGRKKDFDPLSVIAPAEVIRRWLSETERLAERYRILLALAEQMEKATGLKAGSQEGGSNE